jgi:hypothetical protein
MVIFVRTHHPRFALYLTVKCVNREAISTALPALATQNAEVRCPVKCNAKATANRNPQTVTTIFMSNSLGNYQD